jgi:hypothetical protein
MVITGYDSLEILRQSFDTACNLKPLSDKARTALLARTAEAATR